MQEIHTNPTLIASFLHFTSRLQALLAIGLLLAATQVARAQEPAPKPILDDFYGNVQLTNNGISLVPTFSLGDPALIFDLKFVKGRHSF